MTMKLSEKDYREIIEQDIAALEKAIPEDTLEKHHIITVLRWSILELYAVHQITSWHRDLMIIDLPREKNQNPKI